MKSIELTLRGTHRPLVLLPQHITAVEADNEGCTIHTGNRHWAVEEKKAEVLKLMGCLNITTNKENKNGNKTSF